MNIPKQDIQTLRKLARRVAELAANEQNQEADAAYQLQAWNEIAMHEILGFQERG